MFTREWGKVTQPMAVILLPRPLYLIDQLWENITGHHGSPLFDLWGEHIAARPIGTRITYVGTQLNTRIVLGEKRPLSGKNGDFSPLTIFWTRSSAAGRPAARTAAGAPTWA